MKNVPPNDSWTHYCRLLFILYTLLQTSLHTTYITVDFSPYYPHYRSAAEAAQVTKHYMWLRILKHIQNVEISEYISYAYRSILRAVNNSWLCTLARSKFYSPDISIQENLIKFLCIRLLSNTYV